MLYDPERQEQRGDSDRPLALYIVCVHSSFSRVRLFATPWTVARQAPLSMGFSRQEYWSGLHSFLQGIFPTEGSNPRLLHCRQILYCLRHQGRPFSSLYNLISFIACWSHKGLKYCQGKGIIKSLLVVSSLFVPVIRVWKFLFIYLFINHEREFNFARLFSVSFEVTTYVTFVLDFF